jgi:hypothetical protein
LALFVFGMLAAGVTRPDRRERWARVPWGLIALVTGVALVVVIIVVGSEEIFAQYYWVELALGVTVSSLLAALASPSLYLMHVPILRVVWLYFVEPLDLSPTRNFALLAAVGVPAALIGTYLFFLVFERPFVRNRSLGALRARWRRAPSAMPREGAGPAIEPELQAQPVNPAQ